LLQPGKEGATKIVRQPDGKILCYQWTNNQWNCLGDVTGASGGSDESSGKKLFEGKEYDFVFSVDIKDNEPPIKLPVREHIIFTINIQHQSYNIHLHSTIKMKILIRPLRSLSTKMSCHKPT
jgi:hypothetical protein